MSPGQDRQKILNIALVLLVVVVIIGAAYLFLTNSTNNPVIYSVEDVVKNSNNYVGKVINVDGYYNADGTITSIIIPSGSQSTVVYKRLPVDISGVVNASLANDIKYRFTGILESSSGIPPTVQLIAEKIEQV
jgi:flagellar basal body-associated protein FliL